MATSCAISAATKKTRNSKYNTAWLIKKAIANAAMKRAMELAEINAPENTNRWLSRKATHRATTYPMAFAASGVVFTHRKNTKNMPYPTIVLITPTAIYFANSVNSYANTGSCSPQR